MGYIAARIMKIESGHLIKIDASGLKFELCVPVIGEVKGPTLYSELLEIDSIREELRELMRDPFILEQIENCRRLEALGL
jgi:hypothetical protein